MAKNGTPSAAERLAAAEKALAERRGKEPVRTSRAAPSMAPKELLELKRQIANETKMAETRLESVIHDRVEALLKEHRKVEIEVKLPNEVVKTTTDRAHRMFPTLVKVAGMRLNVFMSGPAGSGKSTACKMLADLLDLPFSYTGQTNMPHKVEGSRDHLDKDFYRHTKFTDTFINGGVHVFEEVDAWNANASVVLNPPMANGWLTLENGEQFERHPDAIFIACANTWGTGATTDYVGRNKLDAAFLDRFGAKLDWGYDHELEVLACGNADVAKSVQMARYNANKYGIKVVISPRSSIDISKMVAGGFNMREAFGMNFLAGVKPAVANKLLEDVDFT